MILCGDRMTFTAGCSGVGTYTGLKQVERFCKANPTVKVKYILKTFTYSVAPELIVDDALVYSTALRDNTLDHIIPRIPYWEESVAKTIEPVVKWKREWKIVQGTLDADVEDDDDIFTAPNLKFFPDVKVFDEENFRKTMAGLIEPGVDQRFYELWLQHARDWVENGF